MLSGVRGACHRIFTKIITKKLQKTIAKILQKSYNMVTERATPFWIMKSFSSCFWNIGCLPSSSGCSPSQLSADTAQAIFRFVCKKARPRLDGLFCIPKTGEARLVLGESMTLHQFGGQFACFSAKDIYKVWRGRGLYSARICDKVYTINS